MQESFHTEKSQRAYASVFLISLASLALEVLQMRIFAFSLWHHLAFLVVSIAILGFGAGGAFLSVLGVFQRRDLGRSIWVASGLFAATAFIGPLMLAKNPIDVFNQVGPEEIGRTALYYLIFALPYFFAGWVISLAFTKAPEHASQDLLLQPRRFGHRLLRDLPAARTARRRWSSRRRRDARYARRARCTCRLVLAAGGGRGPPRPRAALARGQ